MKKFNLKKQYLVLIGVVLLFSSCKSLFISTCSEKGCENPIAEYKNSDHAITLEETIGLKKNYDNRFKEVIREIQTNDTIRKNSDEIYNPTEYLWISMEDLKCYINFLEAVEKKNIEQPDISGIAINLGAYNLAYEAKKTNNENSILKKGDYRGRLNVFFSPTYAVDSLPWNDISRHKPFYINYTGSDRFQGTYKLLSDIYEGEEEYNEIVVNNKKPNSLKNMKIANGFQQNSSNLKRSSNDQSLNYNELNAIPPKM